MASIERNPRESLAAYKKRRDRIHQDTQQFLAGRYVHKHSGTNRKQLAKEVTNQLNKTNKCGKSKSISEPSRVEKRFNAMMDGRNFYYNFFRRAGITLHL